MIRESRFASRKERAIKSKAGSGWPRSKPVSMAMSIEAQLRVSARGAGLREVEL